MVKVWRSERVNDDEKVETIGTLYKRGGPRCNRVRGVGDIEINNTAINPGVYSTEKVIKQKKLPRMVDSAYLRNAVVALNHAGPV